MKKLLLSLIAVTMLLSNVAFVSAKTISTDSSKSSKTHALSLDGGIKVNSQDPRG